MKRREFLAGLSASFGAAFPAWAYGDAATHRIGFVFAGSRRANVAMEGLTRGLTERGYQIGRDLIIEERYAEGEDARVPALIAELLASRPEILVTVGGSATLIARKATSTLPIVCVSADPVAIGLAQSLAHPGGNVTGMSLRSVDYAAKWLDILKTAVPRLQRLAVLWEPGNIGIETEARRLDEYATKSGVATTRLSALADDFAASAARLNANDFDALVVTDSPLLELRLAELIGLCARNRLPALYAFSTAVRQGGLMSYSTDFFEVWRRAAGYVDRIFKGAAPGDLPIEQATVIRFAVNLAAAKALELEIPPTLLAAADEVIE